MVFMWPGSVDSATGMLPGPGILPAARRPMTGRRGDRQPGGRIGMRGKLVLLAAVALATVGVARADGFDIIETRQAGQDLLNGTFAGIKAVVVAKGDVKTLETPAKAMARWMKQFPSMFPKGSEEGHKTKALAVIWSDPAGFEK